MKRGRILRDANSGSGLISSEGSQYEFRLEGVWKSDISPKQNMVVEFELDEQNKITAIYAIDENQLVKEQASKVAGIFKEKGALAFNDLAASVGKPTLVATAILILGWFFLSTVTVKVSPLFSSGITFWELLGPVNGSSQLGNYRISEDKGIYGVLAILSIVSPFISQFWKSKFANLASCLPFVLMITVVILSYSNIQESVQATSSVLGSDYVNKMLSDLLKDIHFSIGAYISISASAYLALVGIKKFLLSNIN